MVADALERPGTGRFGDLLRRHRVAAALSQEALAERAGISVRAVSDLERGVKHRPHLETVRLLADALALDAPARAALAAAARPGPVPRLERSAAPTPSEPLVKRLPLPPTNLVGREAEIASASGLLEHKAVRLLTLTGPGGVGKTRLALAIATELTDRFQKEAVWVELAPLADPPLVPAAIVQALGVLEQTGTPLAESLRELLRDRSLLLVLDNCEHLREAVGELVADLLGSCPGLTILTTSRARLRLAAEQVFPVEPLPQPTDGTLTEQISQTAAVRLFVQRAQAARPDFALTDGNAQDIAAICRQLDGLPLAIELAAARTRVLPPATLRALLEERLRVLTGGAADAPERHQTLHAALTWSYDLLDPSPQATFYSLAACAGGCTFEAAAAIAAKDDPFAALEDIEELVDQNLLRAESGPDGDARYAMLETIREFGRSLLSLNGEEEVRDRHAAFFVQMAEQGDIELSGPNEAIWLRRLDADRDNMREALAWLLARGNQADLLRLSSALWSYWHRRGHLWESNDWLERAVEHSNAASPESRAVALVYLANAAINLDDHVRAARHYQASKDLWTTLGNRAGIASCLVGLGLIATSEGNFERAHELYAEAVEVGQDAMSRQQTVATLSGLGELEVAKGELLAAAGHFDQARLICEDIGDRTSAAYLDLERSQLERLRRNQTDAWQLAHNCLAYFRGIGESRATGFALIELGYLDSAGENVRRAAGHFREAYAILDTIDDHLGLVRCMEGLVHLAVQVGRWYDAAVLAGGAGTWRASTGTTAPVPEQASLDEQLSIARQNLGPEAFGAAIDDGSQMPFDQVGRIARGLLDFIDGEFSPRPTVSLPAS